MTRLLSAARCSTIAAVLGASRHEEEMGAYGINGIGHLAAAVRDVEKARETFTRLGFSMGALGRNAALQTAGYSARFADGDSLDLLALEGGHPFTAPAAGLLREREGAAVLGLKADDARAAWAALTAAGLSGGDVVDSAVVDGGQDVRLSVTPVAASAVPGATVLVTQRHGRDALWQGEAQTHENSAQGLAAVIVTAADVDEVAGAYGRLFGTEPSVHGSARMVTTGTAPIVVTTPDSLRWTWGDDPLLDLPSPRLAGVVVRVSSRDAAQQALQKSKLPAMGSDGIFRIGSAHAHGILLALTESLDLGRLIPR